MKNFSLKALGAIIFAAGLVVAGVVAPAQATASLTLSPNTIATSTATSAGMYVELTDAKFQNPNNNSQKLDKILLKPNGGTWTFLQTCTGFSSPVAPALCGIDQILFNNVAQTGWTAYLGSPASIYLIKSGGGTGYTDGQSIKITFLAGALTSPATSVNALFNVQTMYLGGSELNNVTTNFTVGTPTATVTFNSNGGSGTMANQVSGTSAALTSNSFTKAGYTFSGWNVLQDGTGTSYANGATYNFLSNRTLYAQWTAGGGGGGSSASAELTINATTGELVAGSSVAVVASGLQTSAPYTVVVQSTPQTLSPVGATATNGAVNTSVTLPSGLEAGWHSLTFSSTAADGSAMTSVAYFKVSSSGTLLATSTTIPAELANTGVDSTSAMLLLAGGLSLALIGAEMFMIARRKRSN